MMEIPQQRTTYDRMTDTLVTHDKESDEVLTTTSTYFEPPILSATITSNTLNTLSNQQQHHYVSLPPVLPPSSPDLNNSSSDPWIPPQQQLQQPMSFHPSISHHHFHSIHNPSFHHGGMATSPPPVDLISPPHNMLFPMHLSSNVPSLTTMAERNRRYDNENEKTRPVAKLENKDLWRDFHAVGTEMIITKHGRRMFPSIQLRVTNLDPKTKYAFYMEHVPVDEHRYKFSRGSWLASGKADPAPPRLMYVHPDSPDTGSHWTQKVVNFGKMKLTNNQSEQKRNAVLNSMHRYRPRIHIMKAPDHGKWVPIGAYAFEETQFMAVTAYQNEKVTKLKIQNNPFAKGFREDGASTTAKRSTKFDCGKEIHIKKGKQSMKESISSSKETPNQASKRHLCNDSSSPESGISSLCLTSNKKLRDDNIVDDGFRRPPSIQLRRPPHAQYYNIASAAPVYQRDSSCFSNNTGSNHILDNMSSGLQAYLPGVSALATCSAAGPASFTPHNFDDIIKRETPGVDAMIPLSHMWYNIASFNNSSVYPNGHPFAQMMAASRNTTALCRHGLVSCHTCYENFTNTYATYPNLNFSIR